MHVKGLNAVSKGEHHGWEDGTYQMFNYTLDEAYNTPDAQKYLDGMQIVKTIAIPGRIVNIVIKPQA